MEYIIVAFLVALSALFSGLTLGLLSLDTHTLKRQAALGNKEAQIIYPLRKQGNRLLTTLLLGNVAVNAAISIILSSVASGLIAGIVATAVIFLFGEIIPQAVISRYAMWFGARTAFFTHAVTMLLYPITFPIAYMLNALLGEEIPTIYSKHEIMQIISEHEDSQFSTIDQDEERIVHGALQFSHTRVKEAMTPFAEVIMFADTQKLTEPFFEEVNDHNHSRYPVYSGERHNVVGILYTKDLITEDDNVSIRDTEEAFETVFLTSRPNEYLDTLLARMLKQKMHMSIVLDDSKHCIGVITLEDIIEEIIQHEIEDEDD